MRTLKKTEIALLEAQACSAEDWSRVLITDEHSLRYIRNTRFSGDICIGSFQKSFDMPGAVQIVTDDATIYIPLAELIDFEQERKR